jgi:hypothetical protein
MTEAVNTSENQEFKVWHELNASLRLATFAEGAGSGSWEAWADGGKKFWGGTYSLDPNQNFDWYVVSGSDGGEADASEIKDAIRHLVNPLPLEPEPEPEPVDWDRLETEAHRKYLRMFRA